jgi:hypothetical protein
MQAQLKEVTALSQNALRQIVTAEKGSSLKSENFVLQVIEVKQFSASDNKKHMRQR